MVARTLSFRTAVSLSDFSGMDGNVRTLQNILDNLHQRYTTVAERQVNIGGQVLQVRNLESRGGSSLIHLVAFTPDDSIAVVPDAAIGALAADLILTDAPDQTEFLDGEIMFLVNGNNVGLCRCGIGESKLYLYLEEMARRAGYDTINLAFKLYARADVNKMAQVLAEGVHKLSMNAIANEVAIDAETAVDSLLSTILRDAKALIGFEPRAAEDIENLKVGVSFAFNKINGTAIDQESLTRLAQRILDEDESGFVIETLAGNRFKADDVLLTRKVNFEPFGKSIYYRTAWDQLALFYNGLTQGDV